jgi:N-acetylglutamate synthase/N-acetylornithine aminotransferase
MGRELAHDRAAVAAYLVSPVVELVCELGLGDGSATVLTTDLGPGYITENMRTS